MVPLKSRVPSPPAKAPEKISGWAALNPDEAKTASEYLGRREATMTKLIAPAADLSLSMLSKALTSKYLKFRNFTFGLADENKYSKNWNWRCFLATMIVCNTKERDMLAATRELFREFPTQDALLACASSDALALTVRDILKKHKIRHHSRKTVDIIVATQELQKAHGGRVPATRKALTAMRGVGRHVSSVTMAWVHKKSEFGVDVHVRRILERWGYIPKKARELDIERVVKRHVPAEDIGHFSRALVDLGQDVCGYVPDCEACWAQKCCPSSSRFCSDLDW